MLCIGARHITISTVGVAPRIRHLADEGLQVNLAVSLHQTSDAKRSALLPVNNKYPISELLEACRYYINKTNRRISFEWALIEHSTDSIETAHELADLLQGLLCHVNVIPLNPTKGFSGEPSSRQRVDAFVSALVRVHRYIICIVTGCCREIEEYLLLCVCGEVRGIGYLRSEMITFA